MRVDVLIEQINACSAFFESQLALLDRDQVQSSVTAMCNSLKVQIQTFPCLDVSGAALLNQAIASSKFSQECKVILAEAVAAKATSACGTQVQARKTTQSMVDVCSYFTEGDWATFVDANLQLKQKVSTLIERVHKLGLQHPSESTIRSLVALLACCHHPLSSHDELHSLVLDIKASFNTRKAISITSQFVTVYPAEPTQLPEDIYTTAYPDPDDHPTAMEVEGFTAMCARVPLRCTNKHLSTASPTASSSSRHAGTVQVQNAVQSLLNALQPKDNLNLRIYGQDSPPAGASGPGHSISDDPGKCPVALALPAPVAAAAAGQPQQLAITPSALATASTSVVPKSATAAGAIAHDTPLSGMATPDGHEAEPAADEEAADEKAADEESKDVEDDIEAMEKLAMGKANGAAASPQVSKRPAGNMDKGNSAKVQKNILKKPASSAKQTTSATSSSKPELGSGKRLPLGCSKCRGAHMGCIQCRNPSYSGIRYQR